MFLFLLSGIIRWPQISMITGLIVMFIVLMKIPKAVKEVSTAKEEYKDALSENTNHES